VSKSPNNHMVSVVIPAYNADPWIAETLDSVLEQTFRDFEVIVVDDGSTDQTPELAASYGDQIRYLHKENGGTPSARNAGIRAARGSYIAFVDADDLWRPEKLEIQMQLFHDDPDLAWVYSSAILFEEQVNQLLYRVNQGMKMYAGDILRPLLLSSFICSATPVIRRDVFDTVGYFEESFPHSDEWDMWLRIAAKYEVGFVDQPLAKHRIHANSKIGRMNFEFCYRARLTVVENAVSRNPDRLSDLRERAIASVCTGMGQWMLKRKDPVAARKMFARAIHLHHSDIRSFGYWIATFFPVPFQAWLLCVRQIVKFHRLT